MFADGWSAKQDEELADLVRARKCLYDNLDPLRNNIDARYLTWLKIAGALDRPVEEVKQRWRSLRGAYVRFKRGAVNRRRNTLFKKLSYLDGLPEKMETMNVEKSEPQELTDNLEQSEHVVLDNQDFYEVTVVDDNNHNNQQVPEPSSKQIIICSMPKIKKEEQPPKKIKKPNPNGRKKALLAPAPSAGHIPVTLSGNLTPIKILPKPLLLNRPKMVNYVEEPNKTPEQRSQVLDKLIEKVLRENTNEIDVFFRSMAASVKKLQPSLIPKVKMEVCNVIAKYEMQSFDK